MNYRQFTLFLLTLLSLYSVQLPAISAGRSNQPQEKDSIIWQDVYIAGEHFKVTATIPGSPRTILENSDFKFESDLEDTHYWLQTSCSESEKPPKNGDAFIKKMGKQKGEFKKLKSKGDKVKYTLDYLYKDEQGNSGQTRIFVSKNKIYTLGVVGKDLAHAEAFFDSFKIEQEKA